MRHLDVKHFGHGVTARSDPQLMTADDGDPSMFVTDIYNEYVQFNKGSYLTFQSSSG